ncbi:MAG: MFS transporter, partial [Pseudomonadales bacterium]|nr:MFS transporter [Pseudomonadales bacterium]
IWRFLKEPDHNVTRRPAKALKMRYLDRRYREILAIGVVVYLSMAVSTQIMGFYLPHVLSLDAEASAAPLAMTQGISACCMVFVQLVLIQRLQWPPMHYLITGVPMIFVGFIFYTIATELWMLQVAAGFVGFGLGLTGPGYSAEVSLRVEPEEQGAVAGLISACPALGFVIGPLSAGVLYDMRPELPYLLTAVMLLLLFPVLLWVNRKP